MQFTLGFKASTREAYQDMFVMCCVCLNIKIPIHQHALYSFKEIEFFANEKSKRLHQLNFHVLISEVYEPPGLV